MVDLSKELHASCLLCGAANPYGWKLTFQEDVNYTYAIFCPESHLNGYPGVLHGGVVAAVLDEAMVQCLLRRSIVAMTADLQVRYEHPTPIGHSLRVQARLLRRRHALYDMEAQLLDGETVCARANARFFRQMVVSAD